MISTLKVALVFAAPMELVNFFVVGYPANPESVSNASQYPAVALQWYIFHLPGIVASDRSVFLREHGRLDSVVLFLAGYIGAAVFVAVIIWLAHLAHRAFHKLSSPLKHAH